MVLPNTPIPFLHVHQGCQPHTVLSALNVLCSALLCSRALGLLCLTASVCSQLGVCKCPIYMRTLQSIAWLLSWWSMRLAAALLRTCLGLRGSGFGVASVTLLCNARD